MTLDFIKYLIFPLALAYTAMWVPINLFLSSINQGKTPITVISDKKISDLILKKTGLDTQSIKISESPKLFGMMIGIPTKPQLIFSRGLYDSFTPDVIEYVALHEAGHYKLWHSVIELVAGIILLIVGVFILKRIDVLPVSIIMSLILGLAFGVLMIRLGRIHEYQADSYSLARMTNPEGMIQATNKFRNYHGQKYTENNNKIIQFMFYRGNPYDNKIVMAKEEIARRSKQTRF